MDAPIAIRPATVADAAILADLARRTFLETFGPLYEAADMEAFLAGAYGEAQQLRELQDPRWVTLLGEWNGRPAGFAQVILDNPVPDQDFPAPAELNRLYALRECHGSGLGTALMAAAVATAEAAGARSLWLGVWEHNARALAFYRRWRFERVGEHIFRVGTREDTDHILVRRLPGIQ